MYGYKPYDSREFEECGDIRLADASKNLLGVSEGVNDFDIILTYPHVVQTYNLSKQEPSISIKEKWITKLNLTSPVVYDKALNSYVGVFHNNTIRIWNGETSDLTQVVKYTFQNAIWRILTRVNASSIIIFRNGYCVTLEHGLNNCSTFKTKALFKETCTIVDEGSYSRNSTDYICYVVKDKSDNYSVISCPLKEDTCDCNKVVSNRINRIVKDGKVTVTGVKIVSTSVNPVVYFTWSDSGISKYDIVKQTMKHEHYRYMHDIFKNQIGWDHVGKNYFFIYTKSYDQKSEILLPHIDIKGYSMRFRETYSKYTKVYCIGEFVVLIELAKITIFHIIRKDTLPRAAHWSETGLSSLFRWLRPRDQIFPVLNAPKGVINCKNRTLKIPKMLKYCADIPFVKTNSPNFQLM